MAELGTNVTAVNFSEKFISIAKSRGSHRIDYQIIDVTNENDLKKLPNEAFDAIVSTMALMDMENIGVLFDFLPNLLKNRGFFVFSILHPCFNSGENVLVHQRDNLEGQVKNRYSVKIDNYLNEKSNLSIGMIGQHRPQYYFHRPVSTILKRFFDKRFILDAYEEPSFTNLEESVNTFENVFKHIPPALICRLRRL
jgi:hypothetical protein